MNKERRRRLMWMGGAAGVAVGAFIGYLFGLFVFPTMDLAKVFSATDTNATSVLFTWLFAILGGVLGARWGREYNSLLNKRDVQRIRREKYADVIAAYEEEKARDPEIAELAERGQRSNRRAR